ncbi:MAG TPA: ABC transporter permease [Gemmatimonadales bacterium]
MMTLGKDLRYSVRMLFKNPGLTAIAVVALTLGIGLTTTMFSIVYGALFRGLPFPESSRIMHLERNNLSQDIESMEVTIHDYRDWRAQQASFNGLAAFWNGTVNLSGVEGRPERFDGAFMSDNAFAVLGVQPQLGRAFRPEDDQPGAPYVAVIGWTMWQHHFDGDPDILGRTVRLNSRPATIIGVMPEGFAFPLSEEIWLPMQVNPDTMARGEGTTLEVYGRLADGVSEEQAAAAMATIAHRLEMEYPGTNEGIGAHIKPYTEEYIGDDVSTLLFTMLAAVFLVLLIACTNVANLLLARAVQRSKEVAIRSSLGATRFRVVMQFLTETFAIVAVGAAAGIGLAWVGVRLFNNAIVDTQPPFWIDIRIDTVAVVFVVALSLVATLIAGVLPALRASGANVNEVLKDESRGSSSMRIGRVSKGLVTAEIALSCGLLVAAGLMIKSVVKLRTIDYGFPTEVLTARVGLFETGYPDQERRVQFFDGLQTRLNGMPGVTAAALGTALPGLGSGGFRFALDGAAYDKDQDYPTARWAAVSPGYFSTFETEVTQGRDFSVQDTENNLPVVVVNESFVKHFFPGESPLGRRIRTGTSETEEPWMTIVGVVPDLLMDGIQNEDPEGMYVPIAQTDLRFVSLVLRTQGEPMTLASNLRDEVIAIDTDLPLYWVDTLGDRISQANWFYDVFGILFMVFGAAALFLGAVGLYGVMSFSVTSRTQEVGIRMALGAQNRDVVGMIMRQGLWQLGIGLAVGLGIAALLSRGLRIVLFQVEPWDPIMFISVAVTLLAVGLLASFIPARRAARIDPVVALRYD